MPGPDRIVVVERIVAAHRKQLGKRRLDIARLVNGAALNGRGLAVPMPWQTKARQCPSEDRLLQLGFLPALAVIDRNVDPSDLAVAAPGEAADLVKAL